MQPRNNFKVLNKNFKCDYLIIGAGYTGLSAARKLSEINGDKKIVSLRPVRALINTKDKMENNFKGKIEEIIYHGDHTRVRLNLLGNKDFILKVPNSSANMDIKLGNQINVSWNSFDARALDPK